VTEEQVAADLARFSGRTHSEIEVGMKSTKIVSLAIAMSLLLVACSGGGESSVTVEDAWGRTSPAAATNAAFYMEINGGAAADTLLSATSDACGLTELHISVMTDGVMSMQHVPDGIDISADETVMLEPGGLHVMCIDRQQEFLAGDSIPLTLQFAGVGTVDINAEIRDS
jgi:copper(I)-binding protein